MGKPYICGNFIVVGVFGRLVGYFVVPCLALYHPVQCMTDDTPVVSEKNSANSLVTNEAILLCKVMTFWWILSFSLISRFPSETLAYAMVLAMFCKFSILGRNQENRKNKKTEK